MNFRAARLAAPLFLASALAGRGGDGPTAGEISAWFQPDRVSQATLSPDGRHLAYTVHEEEKTTIVLVEVDNPAKGALVPVGEDAVIRNSFDRDKTPMLVPFLQWAGPGRLVFSAQITGIPVVDVRRRNPPTDVTVVYAVDADGRNLTKLADEDDLALITTRGQDEVSLPREPHVIDLAADDPNFVLVEGVRPALRAGRGNNDYYGRLATGVFRIDVRTGKRTLVHDQDVNGDLLYDRQGHPRIEASRPVDKRVESFIYLKPPAGQADSKGLEKLLGDDITPENYLGSRTFPVAFDYDPNILYLASNVGRDTYGLYALDLRARKRTALAVEPPAVDLFDFQTHFSSQPLVFDRSRHQLVGVRLTGLEAATQWLDPELAGLQSNLEGKFPGRNVRIVDWDDPRARILAFVSGGADPGRYFIYHRADDRLVQFFRRDPWVDLDEANASHPFAFDTPEGVHLTGYLTLPRTPRVNPPPLLVYCHGGPWDRDEPGFDRDAQVLAAMGFVVAKVNYRGSAGFGTAFREAIRADLDQLPIADIRATVAWVAAQHKIDHKRVAVLGQGFGGYLALRALQLYPDDFRCAVAINAPTDLEVWCRRPESRQEAIDRQRETAGEMKAMGNFLKKMGPSKGGRAPAAPPEPPPDPVNFLSEFRRWYFGTDGARLAALSPARHRELVTQPFLLIQDPLDLDGEAGESTALRSVVGPNGTKADYLETTSEFTRRLPTACAEVYSRIEDFFNLNLYDYNVKIGQPKVQK